MSVTMRCPDAKAMELGGVDTGSMKAQEQPIVAGTMKYRGLIDTRIALQRQITVHFNVHFKLDISLENQDYSTLIGRQNRFNTYNFI